MSENKTCVVCNDPDAKEYNGMYYCEAHKYRAVMKPEMDLEPPTEIKTPIQAGKLTEVKDEENKTGLEALLEAMEAKIQEQTRTIERICGGSIHAQLARVGITYNIPTTQWRFLDIGQEKDLAALLYKLFELHHWTPPTWLLHNDLREKGLFEEFRTWAAEHAIHLSEEEGMEKVEVKLHPITKQKDLSDIGSPSVPPRPGGDEFPDV